MSGPLPNATVAKTLSEALVQAGIVSAASGVVSDDDPNDPSDPVKVTGRDAAGRAVCVLEVDSSSRPSPATSGTKYGNRVIVIWLSSSASSPPDFCKKVTPAAVRDAIEPAAKGLAHPSRKRQKVDPDAAAPAGAGPATAAGGSSSATGAGAAAAAAAAISGGADVDGAQARGSTRKEWGCCAIEHSVLDVPVPGRPELRLRCCAHVAPAA